MLIAASLDPLAILAIGIATVLILIIFFRANAFLALITAAIVVSMLATGEPDERIKRVALAFGDACGKFAIVIGLAAIIGECMMLSGAADRIVRSSLRVFGERQASIALMLSGFVLAIPVFFDTVFYLMIPLARSLCRQTGKNFLLYVMAIAAGGAATHTLVPPTPGPLAVAGILNVPIGTMILIGIVVAFPSAVLGEFLFSRWVNRILPVPMRPLAGAHEPEPVDEAQLPSLAASLAPILLPVILISADTTVDALLRSATAPVPSAAASAPSADKVKATEPAPSDPKAESPTSDSNRVSILKQCRAVTAVVGNPNLALLISTVVAIVVLQRQRQMSLLELDRAVETSLMSAGVIILITAAGGAFGKMLDVAGVGEGVKGLFAGEQGMSGIQYLFLGYALAAILKVAQGSSTVAMITSAGIFANVVDGEGTSSLGFNPVYIATAIAAGSLMGSWMNDSGFWVFARMSGLTEKEALRSWSPLLAFLSVVGLITTLVLTVVLPMR
jgi:GntP family gluconate:H+ symporter